MPNAGYPEARLAMAEKVSGEQTVKLEEKNIVMTVGAASALNCVFKSILSSGDEVIVPSPFFAEYRHYVANFGGKLVEVPTKADFSLDVQAIEKMLSPKTAAVLINTPNNPTGVIYSDETMTQLGEILSKKEQEYGHEIYLISDEPYRELVYDGAPVRFLTKFYHNTIVGYSFSKSLSLPGERIGYVVVPDEVENADQVKKV